nr:HAD hydrolase family protein [Carboxylicivirga mesophila]
MLTYKKPVKAIKYLVLDVDGVFTDATAAYDKNGELSKQFSLFDGMGLEILREHHVEPIIMTSENSELVKRRMEKLQINKCFLGVKDKFAFLNNLIKELNVNRNELAYLGDDINDLANILSVGWGACPLNAASPVRNAADIKLTTYGGKGAIREFVEFIIGFNSRI